MFSQYLRCTLATVFIATIFSITFASEEEPAALPLDSKITDVTVYSDRAEVTRSAAVKLPEGRHVLVFNNLPEAIDAGSIQVNGTGGVLLQDIRLERTQRLQTVDEKTRKLEDRLQALNDSQLVINSAVTRAESERAFVQKIVDGVTVNGGKEVPVVLDPEKWIKMVTFYRERLDALDEQIRVNNRGTRDIAEQLNLVNRTLNDLRSAGSKSACGVLVTVDVRKEGNMTFTLAYIVSGAQWTPQYDLRMSSPDKKLKVTYKAQISQNTGEDWKNVTVRLSTAQPQSGGQHPDLEPWSISFFSPQNGNEDEDISNMKKKELAAPAQMMNTIEKRSAAPKAEEKPVPMDVATAVAETKATAVVFVAQGKTSVISDNQPYTVTITEVSFPAVLRYSAVPKLTQHAYLKAKVINTTDYPLLPGETAIYLDNAFVAKGTMGLVAPTEEFWTFLGADDAIAVKYQLLKRFQKQEGMIGRKTSLVYEYLMTLTNNKKTEEELVMWDQLPVSNDQDLVVELIEPKYKADTDTLKKNENNYLEWLFKLKPGQEVKTPFSFSVTYPKNKTVYGL
jgi:uncharacterized protein (TIGR02231 family)